MRKYRIDSLHQSYKVRYPIIIVASSYLPLIFASTMKRMSKVKTPSSKLRVLVDTARSIIHCVDQHWKEHHSTKEKFVVGGDELLPLFTYVIIKADIPNLYSQTKLMEFFVADEDLIEQAGTDQQKWFFKQKQLKANDFV